MFADEVLAILTWLCIIGAFIIWFIIKDDRDE